MKRDYLLKKNLELREFLDEIFLEKESNKVEFKSAKGGLPGYFRETYSSVDNLDGVVVIFSL